MAIDSRGSARCCVLLLLCCSQVLILTSAAESKLPDISSSTSVTPKRDAKGNVVLEKCLNCSGTKNKDRRLWNLGTLPPGLITFYKLTYPLDKSWHLLALGYQPGIPTEDIKKAAVIHYNGNNKPWLDLGYACFRGFWAKYVDIANPYILACNIDFSEQTKC